MVLETQGELSFSSKAEELIEVPLADYCSNTVIYDGLLFEKYILLASTHSEYDMLIINKIAGQGVVSVYDVAGRNIAEYKVSDSANIPLASLRKGVYLIQMSDASGIKVQKIIID